MFHPNRTFQAGLNQREARRQRENNSISLRRKSRELKLQTKRKKVINNRNTTPPTTNLITPPNPNPNTIHSFTYNQLLNHLPLYIHGCNNTNPINIEKSIIKIRQLLSFPAENPPIKPIIDSGILPRIIYLLQFNNYSIQFEALWCITNIVSTNKAPEYTANVIRNGALNPLLNILNIQKYPLQQMAVWAIGNIAGESGELRKMILKHNTLQLFLNIISKPFNNSAYYCKSGASIPFTTHGQYIELLNTLSWTISNLCRGMEMENDFENMEYKLQIIEIIHLICNIKNKLLISERIEININIAWICHRILPIDYHRNNNKLLAKMNELNIFQELILLLNGTEMEYQPIIKLIGNIFASDTNDSNIYTQICIENGILAQFNILLNGLKNTNTKIVQEICWSISNINVNYIFLNNVLNENIFPMLCELLLTKNMNISNEVLWIMGNAVQCANENNDKRIIEYLCNKNKCNLIFYLCNYNKKYFINYGINMEKILNVSLDCIENILVNGEKYAILFEEYGGCDFLEIMQINENLSEKLYDKIVMIVKRYFGTENEYENYYNEFNNNNRQYGQTQIGQFKFGCDSENGNDRFEF